MLNLWTHSRGATDETRSRAAICSECANGRCSWVFSGLPAEALAELRRALQPIKYEKGEMIFREGVPSHGAYIVCAGRVKVFQRTPEGKKLILKLVAPGELLGEDSLFGCETWVVSAQALEPVQVKFIGRAGFLALMQKYPSVTYRLLEKLSQEIKAFRCKMLEVVYGGGLRKVARLLAELATQYGTESGESGTLARLTSPESRTESVPGSPLRARLSRADLAEMAGLSTETAIRLLSELESRGLLTVKGRKITVLDLEALRRLAQPLPVTLRENLI